MKGIQRKSLQIGLNGALAIESGQAGKPVSSAEGEGAMDGPVTRGNAASVNVIPVAGAPYNRMRVWLQINVVGAAVDHYDWRIGDWQDAGPHGILTPYDEAVEIDPAARRYLVRTMRNRVRYDSADLARLKSISSPFTQIVSVTAWTAEGEIMGVRHRELAVEGVQFHPESILTPDGPKLMGNFLRPAAPVREAQQ